MNRKQITKLKAGAKIDKLVAVHVMGYKVDNNVVVFPNGDYSYLVPDLGGHWSPSCDMKIAWEVVEHLANDGFCPALLNDDSGRWALSFEGIQSVSFGDEPVDVSTSFFVKSDMWCDSASLAICRAALVEVLK